MGRPFTFIINPGYDARSKGEILSQVNSHAAAVRYAHKCAAKAAKGESKRRSASCENVFSSWSECNDADEREVKKLRQTRHRYRLDEWIPNLDNQLSSTLDPFLRLPIEFLDEEKMMLQFFLCDGRRLAFGSSAHSVYYRTFFSASELQTNSLIHVLVHRLIAESVVRQSNEYSTTFHLRRAQAYRAMNDLIANHFISFQEKMSGFIILSILELALGFPDLHFKHVQAMNRYVEEQGDVLLLWEDTFNPGITPSLPWLFGYFMYDDVLLRNEEALSRAIEGFKSCIQGVEEWTTSIKSLQLWSSLRNDEQERFERRTREPLQLPHIQVYINYILKAVFNKHQSPNVGTAPFFVFLIGLCLTQVAYNYDAEQSINFLQQTERYMSEAPTSLVGDVSPGVCWLSSDMNPPMMWSVRHTICPMSKECEIMYGRFAFDILKIIPLLSWSGTRELAIGLSQCALSLVNSAKLKIPFGTQWAGKQAADIRSNWRQRNLA